MSGSPATEPLPLALGDAVPPEGALAGKSLRHFDVVRFLAAGGMGEVYLATDTALNRPVAIKTLQPALASNPRALSAFLTEARAQANVVHPHVLQVYFLGRSQDGQLFMAMQLVEKGSLQDRLDRGETLSWQEAARHMLGIAEGLAEAARLGIVHRDIKPANLLVDKYGEAHLGDFGLAVGGAELPPMPGAPPLPGPRPTSIEGTPEYMAPEQARGEPVDQRADIYALGATFYQLLTSRTPIPSVENAVALVRAHLGPPPPGVRASRPEVPRQLARVIERCLERDREKRYPTATALVAALRRALPQPVVPASPVVRALAWILEAAPVALLARVSLGMMPWAPFAAWLAATAASLAALGATPGQWLLRLRLRTASDGEVSVPRGLGRFLIQNGWLLPATYFLHLAFEGSRRSDLVGWLAIAFAAPALLGALPALGRRPALHDWLSGTRVLVDTR
ncbi:MAG: protein kinase domain-containing protein [Myxococcales bacterium]